MISMIFIDKSLMISLSENQKHQVYKIVLETIKILINGKERKRFINSREFQ